MPSCHREVTAPSYYKGPEIRSGRGVASKNRAVVGAVGDGVAGVVGDGGEVVVAGVGGDAWEGIVVGGIVVGVAGIVASAAKRNRSFGIHPGGRSGRCSGHIDLRSVGHSGCSPLGR